MRTPILTALTLSLLSMLPAQNLTTPIEPAGPANSFYIRDVPVLGNVTPTKLSFQRVERAMPACDVPVKTILWFTYPDTAKVCLAIWTVDVATNESLSNVPIALNGVVLTRPTGLAYFLEKIDRGQPILLSTTTPAGFVAAGKFVLVGRNADASGSYLAILELVKP